MLTSWVLLLLTASASFCDGLIVRTPVTQECLAKYRKSVPTDFDVVGNGGWYELEKRATRELLGAKRLEELRSSLPEKYAKDHPNYPTIPGGVSTMELFAADPKGVLEVIIRDLHRTAKGGVKTDATKGDKDSAMYLDAVLALLQARGDGFQSDRVDGEWTLLMQRQGSDSPAAQKLFGNVENPGKSYSNFSTDDLEFYGTIKFWKGIGLLSSTVKYRPVSDNFDRKTNTILNGGGTPSIVLRRIMCDITEASVKFWNLPRIKLNFLRRSGGYLDFVYLDDDLRITAGSRGGVFIHARTDYAMKLLSSC